MRKPASLCGPHKTSKKSTPTRSHTTLTSTLYHSLMSLGLRVTQNPSGNAKLVGNVKGALFYATYREVGATCPSTCPLLNAGCYAQSGPTALQARGRSSDSDGAIFLRELARIPHGATVRLHVSGDVLTGGDANGSSTLDVAYLDALVDGARSRPDVTFFGYTHAWRLIDRARFVFPTNFVLNASCDTPEDVAEARATGWDTCTVWPHDVTGKRHGDTVVCPNQTVGLSCAECRLCMKPNRPLTVAFLAHGVSKKKVSKRIELDVVGG